MAVSWLYGVVMTFVVPVSQLYIERNDRVAKVGVLPVVQADLAFSKINEVRAVRTADVLRSLPRWVLRGLLDVPRRSAGADLGGGGSDASEGGTKMGRWLTRAYILGW